MIATDTGYVKKNCSHVPVILRSSENLRTIVSEISDISEVSGFQTLRAKAAVRTKLWSIYYLFMPVVEMIYIKMPMWLSN